MLHHLAYAPAALAVGDAGESRGLILDGVPVEAGLARAKREVAVDALFQLFYAQQPECVGLIMKRANGDTDMPCLALLAPL